MIDVSIDIARMIIYTRGNWVISPYQSLLKLAYWYSIILNYNINIGVSNGKGMAPYIQNRMQ